MPWSPTRLARAPPPSWQGPQARFDILVPLLFAANLPRRSLRGVRQRGGNGCRFHSGLSIAVA